MIDKVTYVTNWYHNLLAVQVITIGIWVVVTAVVVAAVVVAAVVVAAVVVAAVVVLVGSLNIVLLPDIIGALWLGALAIDIGLTAKKVSKLVKSVYSLYAMYFSANKFGS